MIIDKGEKMALRTKGGNSVTIRLEINPKARRLILRLDEKRREAVGVAPHQRMLPELRAFALERADWIDAHLNAMPQQVELAPGTTIQLRGRACRLSTEGQGHRPVLLEGPPRILQLPGDADTFSRRAARYLRKMAREDLADCVSRHVSTLGISVGRISVKDTKSRWGSCAANGNLSFSWRLIMAPPEVLNYVAAHECAHRLEMNHSPRFWAHVARCDPDWKMSRDWLKRHGRSLHAITA